MSEQRLPGGRVTDPVRVGDTVRRRPGPHSPFVHDLLDHFHRHDWPGAPRVLGADEQGRDVLTYLDGHVPWDACPPPDPASLAAVALLLRECHDLTAGTPLAGDQEVVCHNDLSPANTVYRDTERGLRPVAFIDWDIAAPGARVHDVAHVCWQYLDLGPGVPDAVAAGRGMRVVCDAYGPLDRSILLDTVLWWQDRCWRGIERFAAGGDPAMIRLRDDGTARSVRAAHDWVAAHRAELAAGLGVSGGSPAAPTP
ncbi:MAG TPA: phosphotransferase [Pseudonocardiaceae bacterium]|nr:phosphotransferase [Pseudonocardiaceae bacterium]